MRMATRRDLLRTAAAAGSAAVVSWFGPSKAIGKTGSLLPPAVTPAGFAYLTPAEIAFLDAAVSRLIPADELGPGAKEAGVTSSSTSSWRVRTVAPKPGTCRDRGRNGTEQQGYQLKLTPAAALSRRDQGHRRVLQPHVRARASPSLAPADQDKVLHGLEKGEIERPRHAGQGIFQDAVAEHQRRLFRRSDLRWQSRFRRLEAGRLSRAALQLRQRDRAIRQALHDANRRARRPQRPAAPRAKADAMATRLKPVDVVLVGFGWTASILGAGADGRGPRGAGDRARQVSRHRSGFRDDPYPGRAQVRGAQRRCSRSRRAKRSRFAIRSTRPRCRCAISARSIRAPASAAQACTGTDRTGDFCRPTSSSAATSSSATARNSFRTA